RRISPDTQDIRTIRLPRATPGRVDVVRGGQLLSGKPEQPGVLVIWHCGKALTLVEAGSALHLALLPADLGKIAVVEYGDHETRICPFAPACRDRHDLGEPGHLHAS